MPYLHGLEAAGNLVYVGIGRGLAIVDVSNPKTPGVLGIVNTPGVNDAALTNGYVYVTNGSGLHVIDVSMPTQPVIMGSIETPGVAQDVTVVGRYAYLADANEGLRIIDVNIPQAPTEVGFLPSSGIRHVGADGRYAYFENGGYLRIIDVSNPHSPFEAASVKVKGWSGEITAASGYAYLTGGPVGSFEIISVATATSARLIGTHYRILGRAYETVVSEGLVYAITGNEFQIVDVSNPAAPIGLGSRDIASCFSGVALGGEYAYVTSYSYTDVIDVSHPESLSWINTLPAGAISSMSIKDDLLFGISKSGTSQSLKILNIADPRQITTMSTLPFASSASDLAVVDTLVLVTLGDGLQVIDASNVTQPRVLSMLNLGAFAYAVDAQAGFAYVAASDGSVRVVTISNPAQPVEVGRLHLPGSSRDIAVAGNYAFVAAGPRGLYVVDISVPA